MKILAKKAIDYTQWSSFGDGVNYSTGRELLSYFRETQNFGVHVLNDGYECEGHRPTDEELWCIEIEGLENTRYEGVVYYLSRTGSKLPAGQDPYVFNNLERALRVANNWINAHTPSRPRIYEEDEEYY